MEDKPIVEIRAINFFDSEKENLFYHIVVRKEGEETFKKIKVDALPVGEHFNNEFKLPCYKTSDEN